MTQVSHSHLYNQYLNLCGDLVTDFLKTAVIELAQLFTALLLSDKIRLKVTDNTRQLPSQQWVPAHKHTCRQRDRQTGGERDRQADRRTDRQAGRQTDRHALTIKICFKCACIAILLPTAPPPPSPKTFLRDTVSCSTMYFSLKSLNHSLKFFPSYFHILIFSPNHI